MNVIRSMVRYCSEALGDEWEVRMAIDESFGRPFARVTPATPVASTPHGPAHRDLRQTISIVAFPTEGINAESSAFEAARVERLLLDAFTKGIDAPSFSSRSQRAHPMRVPLFDYENVGLRDAAITRIGYLKVTDPPAVSYFPDPSSTDSYVVTADIRVGWNESVAPPPSGPLTQTVTVEPGP